jgi:hypothetical protein
MASLDYWTYLSDEDFDKEVRRNTWEVLFYDHALDRLTDAQFDYCVKKLPTTALALRDVRRRLTIYQRSWAEMVENESFKNQRNL